MSSKMDSEKPKTNFSEQEKLFLIEIISEWKNKIENKKTDGCSLREKQDAWEEITKNFNSQNFSKRTTKQLKKCWENIKQKKRKQNTAIKQHRLITGGGSPLIIEHDPVLESIENVTSNVDVELINPYDSTSVFEKENIPIEVEISKSHSNTQEKKSKVIKKSNKACGFCHCPYSDRERDLRVQKIREAIEQQRLLFEKRLETAEIENKIAIAKLLQAEKELQL